MSSTGTTGMVERVGDQRRDVEEADAAVEERRHGLLVGGVEHAGRGAAGLARGAGERQAAEGDGVRRLEGQRQGLRQVELRAAVAERAGYVSA